MFGLVMINMKEVKAGQFAVSKHVLHYGDPSLVFGQLYALYQAFLLWCCYW